MPAHHKKESFLWQHFLHDPTETVIVLPSPHGLYKHGISYRDACAMGEIYSRLHPLPRLDVRTPELLGSDINKNLIVLAGPKANPLTKELYASTKMNLTFRLNDEVIYDGEQQVMVTTSYVPGSTHTIDHLTVDYGLVLYMPNPFGSSTQVLHLAGIRGCGTLAAAIAVTDDKLLHMIDQQLAMSRAVESEDEIIEILVKVDSSQGQVKRGTVSVQKITVHDRRSKWSWASESYQQLKSVRPYRLSVSMKEAVNPASSNVRITVDEQELRFAKSPDRRNLLYCLAKQSKEDYGAGSDNGGWMIAGELAKELWHIEPETGYSELSPELRRTLAESIMTWVRHLAKKGQLKLDETIPLDHHYINAEILVFDHDMRKRLTDLVYAINHEAKETYGNDFQLIASQHGRGYRLNIHPALISITHLEPE